MKKLGKGRREDEVRSKESESEGMVQGEYLEVNGKGGYWRVPMRVGNGKGGDGGSFFWGGQIRLVRA